MQRPKMFEIALTVGDRIITYRTLAASRNLAEDQARAWAEKCAKPDDRKRNLQHRNVL